MHLAILTLTFRLHGCSSLKEKRHRISGIKEKFSRVTSVAGCESHYHDSWQMCELSFVAISTTRKTVESSLTTIVNYAEKEMDAELLDHKMEWI
ncbi:DUF503 domain-containing protein [Teredinibacter sp. KSP-S5-2]|uniref:DUF503 domain-containing protein n=1 Tax=Teredinibacter sp. KSP-S5-2 TaxID=3034506 RepID=UPI0029349C76|nr:DUF503 domain-containing protein [Teredinibacter sp. KSP-S5-2]WNO10899.1 DUF503 domain-containing protein [Teredinibacter sp. KSP-S5-2]